MADVNPGAVRAMYEAHSGDLFAYLARRVGRQLAEDLLAETFKSAIESFSTFDPGRGSQRGWLFGIATNLVRRHSRQEQQRLRTLRRPDLNSRMGADPLIGVAEHATNRVVAETHAAALLAAVSDLDPGDRDLLILSGWEHIYSREISNALGIESGAVRTRLHRIRRTLRSTIDNQHDSNTSTSGTTS